MTNRQCHEKAAGMGLDSLFFMLNGIDPNAECECKECKERKERKEHEAQKGREES